MKSYISVLVLFAFMSGCATITRGTKEVLLVESVPAGAKVTTSRGLTGKTPATFKVSRKGGFSVTIEKEGYEPVTVQVSNQVAGAGAAGMAGNVIFGGIIGAAVDVGTGATKKLVPNPISVTLVPLQNEKATPAPNSNGMDFKDLGEEEAIGPTTFLIQFDAIDDETTQVTVVASA